MVRTQIQLPNDLYRRVKRLAKEKEWSLADVLRRGAEYMVQAYPEGRSKPGAWKMPEGKDLSKIKLHFSKWRLAAHHPEISQVEGK